MAATFWRRLQGLPESISCWLERHPDIANSIKWQTVFDTNAYDVPETAKVMWRSWTGRQKADLSDAFDAAWKWMASQSGTVSAASETLAYPPANLEDTTNDSGTPWTAISETYAWDLFVRWIALQLVVEVGRYVPWSVTTYTLEQLQILFDSVALVSRGITGDYGIGSGSPGNANYVKRKDNKGTSMIAPPWFTYAFLKNQSIIGTTTLVSINNLLQWMRDNLAHFYNGFTYLETQNHWQYRGNPPIPRIISGTTNTALNQFEHWTAGCHGSCGFVRNVLRALNIPVDIMLRCGHAQLYFSTESLYLDHGDDPYNSIFKGSGLPASALLIDQPTYVAWFGSSTDNTQDGCTMIGHQVIVLAGP